MRVPVSYVPLRSWKRVVICLSIAQYSNFDHCLFHHELPCTCLLDPRIAPDITYIIKICREEVVAEVGEVVEASEDGEDLVQERVYPPWGSRLQTFKICLANKRSYIQ